MSDSYAWSDDQENFQGDWDSREDALSEARDTSDDRTLFWTGKVVPAQCLVSYSFIGEMIREHVDEQLYDEIGEHGEDALTFDDEALGVVVKDWIGTHGKWSGAFMVEAVESHVIEPTEPEAKDDE
jgi:hypothetical protein